MTAIVLLLALGCLVALLIACAENALPTPTDDQKDQLP